MPIFMCQALARMKRSRMIAIGSEPRICAEPAWLRPISISTITITGTMRSVIATAVRRWRQKSEVPECDDPDQHRQRNAADQRAPCQRLALIGLEAVAEIPDEMAQT